MELVYLVVQQQILTFESYADCCITSGAIQKGVPTNVSLFICVSVSWPATPKSASLTSPSSDNKTFAARKNKKTKYKTIKHNQHLSDSHRQHDGFQNVPKPLMSL